MTQLMPKVLIADTRSKVNDIDEIYFDVIVLFYHGDIMNKTWERPSVVPLTRNIQMRRPQYELSCALGRSQMHHTTQQATFVNHSSNIVESEVNVQS